jgi:uncharacterized glyoxalase superfamily protein PhnB
MAARSSITKPNIFPVFRYQDAPAAISWLTKALGFAKLMEVPGPDGTIAHAELQLGPGIIMLGSVRHESKNPWATVKQSAYLCVDDADAHYARAKAAGAQIVRELQDTEYGSREYGLRDPEGFLWGVGTFCPDTKS